MRTFNDLSGNNGGGSVHITDDGTENVAASQTAQVLGDTGAIGDYLDDILIIPTTTSPGSVTIIDGSTSTVVFNGGASSVSNLVPFTVPVQERSQRSAWKITTGANVAVRASGTFT